jgi:hypothetical protein
MPDITVHNKLSLTPPQYLTSILTEYNDHYYLITLLKQWECINFARDWKCKGQLAGGKFFKTCFTRLIYKAHTGHRAPVDNESTKEEKQLFKQF